MNLKFKKKDKKWYHISFSTIHKLSFEDLKKDMYIRNIISDEKYLILSVRYPYIYVQVDKNTQERINENNLSDYEIVDIPENQDINSQNETDNIDNSEDHILEDADNNNINTDNEIGDTDIADTDISMDVSMDMSVGAKAKQSEPQKTEAELMLEKIRSRQNDVIADDIPTTSSGSRSLSGIKQAAYNPSEFREINTTMDSCIDDLARTLDNHNDDVLTRVAVKECHTMDNLKGLKKPIVQSSKQFSSNISDMISQLEWSTVSISK